MSATEALTKFQGRLVGDDRVPSQARLSVSAFIRCAFRDAWLLHFGLLFVIVRGHRLSLPNISVELDVKLLKFDALFFPAPQNALVCGAVLQ
jgi:hypothetical protein